MYVCVYIYVFIYIYVYICTCVYIYMQRVHNLLQCKMMCIHNDTYDSWSLHIIVDCPRQPLIPFWTLGNCSISCFAYTDWSLQVQYLEQALSWAVTQENKSIIRAKLCPLKLIWHLNGILKSKFASFLKSRHSFNNCVWLGRSGVFSSRPSQVAATHQVLPSTPDWSVADDDPHLEGGLCWAEEDWPPNRFPPNPPKRST